MAGGRPTDYDEKYCEMLIEHMEQGLSFESFAGLIGCASSTLYNWEKDNPEFLEAKKIGFDRNRLFYERAGINMMKDGQGSATVWLFNMKNRFPKQWRDKQEVESTNVNYNHNKDVTEWTDEELDAATRKAMGGGK